REEAHRVLVLDEEDGALAGEIPGPFGRRRGRGAGRRRRVFMERQIDAEGRALAHLAFGEDEASRLLDDAVDGGKAEPRPLPHFLGGEEGLEDLAEIFFRDADTRVAHLD